MLIGSINNLVFGYKHALKKLYRQGKLPSITRGLYGGKLTQDTVSLEHLIPHCKKNGHTILSNLALATKKNNNARGSQPLSRFLTQEQADRYFDQFRGINVDGFNGDHYIRVAGETVRRLLSKGKK